MRSKKKIIGALIVVIVVLLGFVGSLLLYRNKSSSENAINDSDVYTLVDKEIDEIIDSDAFENASLEERKEIVLNLLNRLESESRIKKGSIKFNKEYNSYFFEYLYGGECSILLESFSSKDNDDKWETLSIDTSYIPSNTYDSNGKEFLNNSANGYIKSALSDDNLIQKSEKTALIVDEINGNNIREDYNNQKEIWSSNGLKTSIKQNVTVEEFKTILIGYDFIEIIGHGYPDYDGNPSICLNENQSYVDIEIRGIKYYDDIKSGRVGRAKGRHGGNFYLTSKFFSYYYKNQLSDTIVWISSCGGYRNDTLVSVFANECNAKSVIGATDDVYVYYNDDMVDIFVHKLLFGLNVDEALKEAKLFFGKNDEVYRFNPDFGDGKIENTPAEFKNYNGGNETLVELVTIEKYGTLSGTVIDESGNPVKNAEVLAITVRGSTQKAVTNENGRFIINDCPVDSYQIEVSAEGYELYQSDEFLSTEYVVLEGEEPKSVTIQLKKIAKEYTEAELKEKVISATNGNIGAWIYEDFDGDGTKEAYAVITGTYDSFTECNTLEDIYFINANSEITKMPSEFWGGLYYPKEKEYFIYQGKGFFSVDSGNGGSGWQTLLYSVKEGLPYELDISRTLQGFYEKDGIYYTTENEFLEEGGHSYPEVELIYDSSTQQFSKGNRITSKENNETKDWKNAYIEVLSNLNQSSARFMTAYIDEDDIPELVVAYDSSHVAGCEIYTYCEGKVSKLESENTNGEFGSSGEILYLPHKNLFNSRYYGTGSNSDSLFRISNGSAQLECALQHNDYFTNVRVIEFKIDGIEKSENEYWDKYHSYEIDSMVSANYDDMVEVSSTNISNYFN